MKLIPTLIAAALAALATPAIAAPVYLSCVFANPAYPIKVTVDEEQGTVMVYLPHSGFRRTSRATFTSDAVVFFDGVKPNRLSRVDLGIVRGEPGEFRPGRCAIERVAERAF